MWRSAEGQGFEPCEAVLEAACSPRSIPLCQAAVRGVEPRSSAFTVPCASVTPHAACAPVGAVIPGGLEPPPSSVSGRRPRRWTTGSIGKEPGRGAKVRRRTGRPSSLLRRPSPSTPARSRTWIPTFGGWCRDPLDHQGVCRQRKERESNPHALAGPDLAGRRVTSSAHPSFASSVVPRLSGA